MEDEEPNAIQVSRMVVLLTMLRSTTLADVEQNVRPKLVRKSKIINMMHQTTRTTTTTMSTTSTTTASLAPNVAHMLEGKRREI